MVRTRLAAGKSFSHSFVKRTARVEGTGGHDVSTLTSIPTSDHPRADVEALLAVRAVAKLRNHAKCYKQKKKKNKKQQQQQLSPEKRLPSASHSPDASVAKEKKRPTNRSVTVLAS